MSANLLSDFTNFPTPLPGGRVQEWQIRSYILRRHPRSHIYSIDLSRDDCAEVIMRLPTGIDVRIVVGWSKRWRCFYNKKAEVLPPETER